MQGDTLTKKPGAGLLFVLTCAMGVGPLMNYGLSATSPLIIEDLQISESQFGLLATIVFFTAALSAAWLGRLSDKVSAWMQMLIIFGGTALALLVMALAPNYSWLLVAVALAGPAQAISNPTTNRLIIHHVPAQKRPGWIGVKQSGVQGSQLFSGLFFPAAALYIGWQGAAGVAAAIAVGLLLWGLKLLPVEPKPAARSRNDDGGAGRGQRADREANPAARPAAGPSPATGTAAAAGSKRLPAAVWVFAAYAFLSGAGTQATNVYLPLFAQRELDYSLVLAGITAAVSGVVGVMSRIGWGRQMARGVPAFSLLFMLALGAVLGAVMLLLAGLLRNDVMLWAGVVLHGAMVLGVNVIVMAGVMKSVPAARVGAASGVASLGMYFGFALGPLTMGLLLERTGAFAGGWLFVGAGYVVCAVLALVARRRVARPPAVA